MNDRIVRRALTVSALAIAAALIAGFAPCASAATPASGSINASTTTPLTWVGSASGGASAGESSCVEGASCDTYTLTVGGAPSDYATKLIKFDFTWTIPATDYDFYIHKDKLDGPTVASGSNGGAPATSDQAAITPSSTGTGVYVIHVVYFSSPGPADQYHATATVASATPASRTATYINSGIAFSPNVQCKAPLTTRDGEPSNRTDFKGNAYVGGIRGFPAGVDLWYFDLNPASPTYDPFMRIPQYRGQPDAFSPTSEADLGGDGGGDIDLAVGFGVATGKTNPTLAYSSLIAANVSTGQTFDLAKTYSKNPAGNVTGGVPADDRQWEEFLGAGTVYLYYRTLEPAVTQIQRSTDGGFTFGPAATAGTTSQVGPIDVHQSDGVVYGATSTGTVIVGTPTTSKGEPTTADYKVRQAAVDPAGVAHLFFITKIADDGTPNGTLYACYSNDKDILLKSSADKGVTWTDPVKVNSPALGTKVNVFPWMETGPTKGSVGIVWFGTSNDKNDDNAEWKVYFAQSFNADAANPVIGVAEVTEPDHVIHASNISEGGLTGAANRNLIDYFQVSFDPNGAAVVAYTDDHNDYDGHTYVAHQIAGPSINNGVPLPAPAEGSALVLPPGDLFPPRVPGLNGEQVTDYPLDLQESSVARVRQPDPSDIVAVRYDTSGTGDSLAIAATMKVSDLSVIPGQTTWQMNFAVNAPHSTLSPTGNYSFGASDHGDQFYVQADTDVNSVPKYSYGKAVRASDGKIIYTKLGDADAGEFNQADNTVSVMVKVSKLNAALPTGHTAIGNGSVVSGLRARSYTVEVVPPVSGQASRQGRRDIARGGTQFVVHDSAQPYPAPTPAATPLPPLATPPTGATPPPVDLANISTRIAVKNGDQAGIGGFIIRGTKPKRVMIRGIGPSVAYNGNALANLSDPILTLKNSAGATIGTNDDWRSAQQAEISASGLAPVFNQEAAIIAELAPGNYTAILNGKNGGTGIGLIEAYDLEAESLSDFGNISTRGVVETADNVLIGGFIIRDNTMNRGAQKVVVRALGPSLTSKGVTGVLQNPTIELHDANGVQFAFNDDWRDQQQTDLQAASLAPTDDRESAIITTLNPGAYTAVVRGRFGGVGVGLVEVYNLGKP